MTCSCFFLKVVFESATLWHTFIVVLSMLSTDAWAVGLQDTGKVAVTGGPTHRDAGAGAHLTPPPLPLSHSACSCLSQSPLSRDASQHVAILTSHRAPFVCFLQFCGQYSWRYPCEPALLLHWSDDTIRPTLCCR